MAFNPEVACKANDNRISGLERTLETFQKEFRAAGYKSLEDRLTKLEAVVKALAESRLDTKVQAMDKTLKALDSSNLVDKTTLAKMTNEMFVKQKSDLEKEQKAMTDIIVKEQKVLVDKAIADSIKRMLEARIVVLEAKVASLGR